MSVISPITVEGVSLRISIQMLPLENSTVADEPRKTPYGVGAAAETEQEELVSWLIIIGEEKKKVFDAGRDPHTEGPTGQMIPEASPFAHSFVVQDDLGKAVRILREHGARQLYHVGISGHALIRLFGFVPCPIGTDHQP